MSHADEHITDPRVFRLRVSSGPGYALFGWDYPGSTLLEVRVVRSTEAFASNSDDPARPVGQRIVFQGVAGSFRDADVVRGSATSTPSLPAIRKTSSGRLGAGTK